MYFLWHKRPVNAILHTCKIRTLLNFKGDPSTDWQYLHGLETTRAIVQRLSLPEIRGHPIVGLAKIFHNSFNWMRTFSMGINENKKLPNFRSSRLL